MSHLNGETIHGYVNRGMDIQIAVTTSSEAADFSSIGFRVQDIIDKTGLSADDSATGVTIDVSLTAADMVVAAGWYRWECYATVNSQPRTLAHGQFLVGAEPTTEESSS